jgi:hypothetical protein
LGRFHGTVRIRAYIRMAAGTAQERVDARAKILAGNGDPRPRRVEVCRCVAVEALLSQSCLTAGEEHPQQKKERSEARCISHRHMPLHRL